MLVSYFQTLADDGEGGGAAAELVTPEDDDALGEDD